jgi:hypothetical protein
VAGPFGRTVIQRAPGGRALKRSKKRPKFWPASTGRSASKAATAAGLRKERDQDLAQ